MAKTKLNLPPSLFLEDGTEVRILPLEKTGGKALYVSADGRCFSYFRCILRLVKPQADTSKTNRFNAHRKQKYLRMTSYGNILVHIAVAIVWIGPKPGDEFECDHLNGITTDNRVTNLQWVTQAENRKRAVILRARRMVARQDNDPSKLPENMKPEELLALFNAYNVAGDCYEGE
jgi:hypothetical protein